MMTQIIDVTNGSPQGRGERRKQHTRRRLLDAAALTYADVGIEGATISAITERGDVGLGTFYLHFEDKETIATAVCEIVFNRLVGDENRALDDVRSVGGEPDPLAIFTRVICGQTAENAGLLCALLRWTGPRPPAVEGSGGGSLAEVSPLRRSLLPHLTARFQEGVESGRYRVEEPVLAAQAVLGVYVSCIPAWVGEGRTDWDVLGAFAQRSVVAMFRRS